MLLLDTQIVIWLAQERERISRDAMLALRDESRRSGGLAVAAITLWEIAMLGTRKKVAFDPPVEQFLAKVERAYHVLPLDRRIAMRGQQFTKRYPKDPADRQIGATAIIHGLHLITADGKILSSGEVPCLW